MVGAPVALLVVVVTWLWAGEQERNSPSPSKCPVTATRPGQRSDAPHEQELSDTEILGSSTLSFEQKRSKLYALWDVAEAGLGVARHEANYVRTVNRLDGRDVRFTPGTERSFGELIERVQSYLSEVGQYTQVVVQRETCVKKMEASLYEELRSGRLKPSARELYIAIVGQAHNTVASPFGWVFTRDDYTGEYLVVSDLRGRILRRDVEADDLFMQLVAIRACQRCLGSLGEVDDRIAQLMEMLPEHVLSVGGFSRNSIVTEQDLNEARAEEAKIRRQLSADNAGIAPTGQSGLDYYLTRRCQEAGRDSGELLLRIQQQRVEDLESALRNQKPTGVVMTAASRAQLLSRLSKDAGIVEVSLGDLLLDYPWPWPVPTTVTETHVFLLASRPTP